MPCGAKGERMKKYILTMILITFFSVTLFGQKIEDFEKDFINTTKMEFTEADLNKMFQTYSNFLTPHSDMTQLMANLKNEQIVEYPLSKFKETASYKNNIKILFNSKNENQRLLSYLVIAGAGDIKFEKKLLKRIKTEKSMSNIIWAGMALMHLKTNHTTALFDFLVEYENFGDSHMIPLYFQLNKNSLQKTAYDRINSENEKAKVLAAQIFSVTGKNKKTEKLLLDAVKNWDYSIKGYAIYSVKELRIGNLKNTFIPLLNNTQTRRIAIQALANSPTKEDVDYLKELSKNENPISKDLLDGENPEKRVVSITNILIENKLDTLQTLYEKIYQTEKSLDWQRSSIEYLSNFPKQNYKKIFLKILENTNSDFSLKRNAAIGLANLKDETSVDTIVKVCENERLSSDYNAQIYLVALSKIKGEKAKKYIETYKKSKENMTRELANELLANWNN